VAAPNPFFPISVVRVDQWFSVNTMEDSKRKLIWHGMFCFC
jgi:hypothetical protein